MTTVQKQSKNTEDNQGVAALEGTHERLTELKVKNEKLMRSVSFLSVALFVTMLIIAGLAVALVRTKFEYFAVDPYGRLKQMTPLNQGVKSHTMVKEHAVKTLLATYSLDFVKYREQVDALAELYTQGGYSSVRSMLEKSDLLRRIQDERLVGNPSLTAAAIITKDRDFGGVYKWLVEVPFVLTLEGSQKKATQNLKAAITVVRVSEAESPTGLKTEQIIVQ